MSREKSDSSGGGLQIQTLLISAVSAVVAATVVPLFWQKGTVIATAMTPIIVALVSEGLRRPVQRVTAVAPKVAPVRRRPRAQRYEGDAVRGRPRTRVGSAEPDPHDFRPVPDRGVEEPVGVSPDDPFGLREPEPGRRFRGSWWRAGLITGALAFVLAAGVVTASELAIFHGSVSGRRGETTLFGGSTTKHRPKAGESNPKATPAPHATATPQATATPAPSATATPTATPTPSATPSSTPTPQGAAPQATPTP